MASHQSFQVTVELSDWEAGEWYGLPAKDLGAHLQTKQMSIFYSVVIIELFIKEEKMSVRVPDHFCHWAKYWPEYCASTASSGRVNTS